MSDSKNPEPVSTETTEARQLAAMLQKLLASSNDGRVVLGVIRVREIASELERLADLEALMDLKAGRERWFGGAI